MELEKYQKVTDVTKLPEGLSFDEETQTLTIGKEGAGKAGLIVQDMMAITNQERTERYGTEGNLMLFHDQGTFYKLREDLPQDSSWSTLDCTGPGNSYAIWNYGTEADGLQPAYYIHIGDVAQDTYFDDNHQLYLNLMYYPTDIRSHLYHHNNVLGIASPVTSIASSKYHNFQRADIPKYVHLDSQIAKEKTKEHDDIFFYAAPHLWYSWPTNYAGKIVYKEENSFGFVYERYQYLYKDGFNPMNYDFTKQSDLQTVLQNIKGLRCLGPGEEIQKFYGNDNHWYRPFCLSKFDEIHITYKQGEFYVRDKDYNYYPATDKSFSYNIIEIGEGAFENCSLLQDSPTTHIKKNWNNCHNGSPPDTWFILPRYLQKIGARAFHNCYNMHGILHGQDYTKSNGGDLKGWSMSDWNQVGEDAFLIDENKKTSTDYYYVPPNTQYKNHARFHSDGNLRRLDSYQIHY